MKYGPKNNEVSGNEIENNGKVGIYLATGSDENEIKDNIIINHREYGIRMIGSSNNDVLGNRIRENRRGVNLRDLSVTNYIANNVVEDIDQHSFFIQNASGNILESNNVVSKW